MLVNVPTILPVIGDRGKLYRECVLALVYNHQKLEVGKNTTDIIYWTRL